MLKACILVLMAITTTSKVRAQEKNTSGQVIAGKKDQGAVYQKPDPKIDQFLRATGFAIPLLNDQRDALLLRYTESMPAISYVARPQMKLAGERFSPKNYSAISNYYITKIDVLDLNTNKKRTIDFPKGSILRETQWSPDGKSILVSRELDECQELWLVNAKTLSKKKIPVCLNAVLGRTVQWLGSEKVLLAVRTLNQKNAIPQEKQTPRGPVIQETGGKVSQNRTYTDLLKTDHDEDLFARAIESQLAIFNVKTGSIVKIGKPQFFAEVSASPDQKFLLNKIYQRPFSKVVPHSLFARRTEVWDLKGNVVAKIDEGGPFESLPIQGVPTGPRSMRWVGNLPSTLMYVRALDQGDWNVQVPHRDELYFQEITAKGAKKAESILKLTNRFAGFLPLDADTGLADHYIVYDYERDKEWEMTLLLNKTPSGWKAQTVFSRNENDSYGDPGSPVLVKNKFGKGVVAVHDGKIFFSGKGASPDGDLPFLRSLSLNGFTAEEIFRSEKGSYEDFYAFKDKQFSEFFTQYETQKISPRIFSRKIDSASKKAGASKLVYADANPYEELSKIKKEVITYSRADGVKLSGVLYLPPDFDPKKKYPAIISAYPLEYTDAATAGQVRGTSDKYSVPFRDDIMYHTLRGFVVLDDAQMPIIGHPETKNDTYIEQLVSGAKAAVDALDARGLIDRKKVGVVGHSYGAFMVANLLTHSDLFSVGVARSGAYNRTLTPFGFQGERRTLWKARDVYLKMSPFMEVEKMKRPLLLIHGMVDSNSGTFPIQTERYFEALKGQGAPVRMVLLPEEDHGYAAYESVAHVFKEMSDWFDQL